MVNGFADPNQPAAVLKWTYDADRNQLTYTDALGRVSSETWDKLNRLISQLLPPQSGSGQGPATSYFYDADGRQNQVENAMGQYTTTVLQLTA